MSIFTTGRADQSVAGAEVAVAGHDGVTIRSFPASFPRRWWFSAGLGRALRQEIPNVDLVHLHSLYLFHCRVVGRECQRSGVPYVVMPHGALDPFLYRHHRVRKLVAELSFQNAVTRGAAAFHFTTDEERRLARPFVPGAKAMVVPLGLELAAYDQLPHGRFRAAYPEIGDRPIILFLGRLNFKKGLDVLVRAFAGAVRKADAHLVIAGPEDGMGAKVSAWLRTLGLERRTTRTGMVTGTEKLGLLADADIFVLPSFTENFGIAVTEAMACGLPVVISDRVNLWRDVAKAGAGWVEAPRAEAIEAALVAALSDPVGARAKGARGKELVARQYAWPRIAKVLEREYAALI